MRFCTVAAVSELPYARSLADRISEHHPGERLVVLVLGSPSTEAGEPFDVVPATDLGLADVAELASLHAPDDLRLILQPHFLLRLFDDGGDGLVYLDPAHEVLGPLEPVATELTAHPIVLSKRADGPPPEDRQHPSPAELRDAGLIDPGFVALRPDDDRGAQFLGWWARRADQAGHYVTATRGAGAPEQGRRRLRRLLDVAPAIYPHIGLLSDPRLEISGWNLHDRQLADALSLSTAGFRPDVPHVLAPGMTRVTPTREPLLGKILETYAARLHARGWPEVAMRAHVGRPMPNGLIFSERLLRLYFEALAGGHALDDPFTPEGARDFLAWLRAPAHVGAEAGVSRYLFRAYLDRPDVPVAYPDLDGPDGEQFIRWAWLYGRSDLQIPDELLPPAPEPLRAKLNQSGEVSVNVAGYLAGTLGLGEAARLYVAAFEAVGVPVGTRTVDPALPVDPRSRGRHPPHTGLPSRPELLDARFNLVCVNADEFPRFVRQVEPAFLADRPTIAVWAWETDVVPQRWGPAFELVDEIWAYSRYVAENLSRVSPVPVVPIPPPVLPPEPAPVPDLGLPDGFRFMFMFDFFSTIARKNPVGVIEAYKRAFGPGEGPHLVIKTIHGDDRPVDRERVLFAAADHPDIHVVDRALSTQDKNGLLGSCDCYVSLHRSEGWGLPLAECMAMGKPVIATAFSGNLDFMTPGNCYPVDYHLIPVGADVEIYPAEGRWAEPDIDHAARQLRSVWDDREESRRRGAQAAADVAEQLNAHRTGQIAKARLANLLARGVRRA